MGEWCGVQAAVVHEEGASGEQEEEEAEVAHEEAIAATEEVTESSDEKQAIKRIIKRSIYIYIYITFCLLPPHPKLRGNEPGAGAVLQGLGSHQEDGLAAGRRQSREGDTSSN